MPEWLIWTIVILIWIGIQVCDFKGVYSVSKGVLGEYTATSFSESRDGIVFLIICWGLCTKTGTISKKNKFIKEIRRKMRKKK